MLPGTLVLILGFFSILHSWLNAFAEMLRFADRMFYRVCYDVDSITFLTFLCRIDTNKCNAHMIHL